MGLTGQSLRGEGQGISRRLGNAWHLRTLPSIKKIFFDLLSRAFVHPGVDRLLDRSVRRLDAFLRRCQEIIEFTQDDQCILRVSLKHATKEHVIDGQVIAIGDPICEIHLWNEHIPPAPLGGADIGWGFVMRRRLQRSLIRLAAFVESDPRFAGVKLFCGETAFSADKSVARTRCMASFFGFHITEHVRPGGFFGWWSRLGEAIYLWGMIRTFNRGAMKLNGLTKPKWFQFWMTRETLLSRYSDGAHSVFSYPIRDVVPIAQPAFSAPLVAVQAMPQAGGR